MSEENEKTTAQEPAQTFSVNERAFYLSITPFLVIVAALCVLHWTNVIRWSWWGVVFSSMGIAYLAGCFSAADHYPQHKKSLAGNFHLAAILTCCILKWTDIISWSWWAVIFLPFSLGLAFGCCFRGVYVDDGKTPDISLRIYSTVLFGFLLPFGILKWTDTISWSWWWSIAVVLGGWLVAYWIVTAFHEHEEEVKTPHIEVEMLHLSDLDELFGAPGTLKTLTSIDDAHAIIDIISTPVSKGEKWYIDAGIKNEDGHWIDPEHNAIFFLADDIDEDLQKLLYSRENKMGSIDLTSRYVECGN
ncbi:MAG: hypothetical protein MJ016_03520 [Victivallaceae bacterium]|nr:hypothetical protein [Victivallaceae bacterium]